MGGEMRKKYRNRNLQDDTFILIEMALVFLINLSTVLLQSDALTSFFFSVSFIVLLCAVLFFMRKKFVNLSSFFAILSCILCVVLNILLTPSVGLSMSFFSKMMMFITTVLFFDMASKIYIKEKTACYLLYIPICIALLYLAAHFLFGNNIRYGGGLTLGFPNPNFTAAWLMHLIFYMLIFGAYFNQKKTWLLSILMCGGLIVLLLDTLNRSTLIALAFFFVLAIIGLFRKKYTFKSGFIFLVTLMPLLIPLLYELIAGDTFSRIFAFMVSEGKKLNSREAVWGFAMDTVMKSPIIGDCLSVLNYKYSQMHNTHLDIMASYGLVTAVIFMFSLNKQLRQAMFNCTDYCKYLACCAVFAVIVFGTFEATIYSGSTGLSYLTGGLLLLAHMPDKFIPAKVKKARRTYGKRIK